MKNKEQMLLLAEQIATKAHKGQVDKAGADYINHPRTVASMCNSVDAKIVGWLHDVVEDTAITFEDLKNEGFSNEIIEALKCITKEPGFDNINYYLRIKNNDLAREVKLADLTHNSDLSRLPVDISNDLKTKMQSKYQKYCLYKLYLSNSQDGENLNDFIKRMEE